MNFVIKIKLKKRKTKQLFHYLSRTTDFDVVDIENRSKKFSRFNKLIINCKTSIDTLRDIFLIDEGEYFKYVMNKVQPKYFLVDGKEEKFYLSLDKLSGLEKAFGFATDDKLIYEHN